MPQSLRSAKIHIRKYNNVLLHREQSLELEACGETQKLPKTEKRKRKGKKDKSFKATG